MNGKLNLFIRCLICFCTYIYSISAFANTEYIYTSGTWNVPIDNNGQFSCSSGFTIAYSVGNVSNMVSDYAYRSASRDATWKCAKLVSICVSPQVRNPTTFACETPPPPTPTPKNCQPQAGQLAGNLIWSLNSSGNNKGNTCSGGCMTNASDYKCGVVSGKTYCTGSSVYTGQTCIGTENPNADSQTEVTSTPSPSLPPNVTPTPKPKTPSEQKSDCIASGRSFGEVNGQIVCVKSSNETPTTETKTITTEKTNPDGTKTTTKTETTSTDTGNGKVKTDTTTTTKTAEGGTRPDGTKCTTVGGCTDVEGEGKEQPKDDYCKENPKAKQCMEHNKEFSASCTNFKCSNDDPATCEIARLQWQTMCEEKKQIEELTKSNLFKDGEEILKGKLDDDSLTKLGLTGDDNMIDLTDTFKDSKNGFLSCSRGLSDKNVRVIGKSFIIPFSKMNPFLEIMGKIAVIFTMVVAARIIVGGVK